MRMNPLGRSRPLPLCLMLATSLLMLHAAWLNLSHGNSAPPHPHTALASPLVSVLFKSRYQPIISQGRETDIKIRRGYTTKDFLAHGERLQDLTDADAEDRFFDLLVKQHVICPHMPKIGHAGDGGWQVCLSPPYTLTPGACLVYSFGISRDWSFDDEMDKRFQCQVYSFDPSIGLPDHKRSKRVAFFSLGLGGNNTVTDKGWRMVTLPSIMTRMGHRDKVIDILKIDIDYGEWRSLRAIIQEKTLKQVKQLVFEIHTPKMFGREATKEQFLRMYNVLLDVEKSGFRRFHVHLNQSGEYRTRKSGKFRSCCYELYYINMAFL